MHTNMHTSTVSGNVCRNVCKGVYLAGCIFVCAYVHPCLGINMYYYAILGLALERGAVLRFGSFTKKFAHPCLRVLL